MSGNSIGRWGEAAAADYLMARGYRILERGYYGRYGEIDLIAENGEYLVFVEVKTRKDDTFARACEYVSPAKQRRIVATAKLYLMNRGTGKQPRFDVIEVYAPQGVRTEKPVVNHLENAFYGY